MTTNGYEVTTISAKIITSIEIEVERESRMAAAQNGKPVTEKQAAYLARQGYGITATCDGEKASQLIGILKTSLRPAIKESVAGVFVTDGYVTKL